MNLHIHLFGYLQIKSSQHAQILALRPRAQCLLVYLLLERRRHIPRAHLAYKLWPDPTEESALGILRRALSELRDALTISSPSVKSECQNFDYTQFKQL
jgi:DNA-binding SARP family transcriptional activator